jgi:hypothetical protein
MLKLYFWARRQYGKEQAHYDVLKIFCACLVSRTGKYNTKILAEMSSKLWDNKWLFFIIMLFCFAPELSVFPQCSTMVYTVLTKEEKEQKFRLHMEY